MIMNGPQKGKDINGITGWYKWCDQNTPIGPCGESIFKHQDLDAFDTARCLRHKGEFQKEYRIRKKRNSGYSSYQYKTGGFQRSLRA